MSSTRLSVFRHIVSGAARPLLYEWEVVTINRKEQWTDMHFRYPVFMLLFITLAGCATIDGVEVVETSEPLASGWRKFSAWFLKIAPERQL